MELDQLATSAFGWMLAAGVTLLIWALKQIHSRLTKLEGCLVSKTEFEKLRVSSVDRDRFNEHVAREDLHQADMRKAQSEIYQSLDALKTVVLTNLPRRSSDDD